jgi:hypothetical protein
MAKKKRLRHLAARKESIRRKKMMSKKQYNKLRAAALTPEYQAKLVEYLATYDQRPEVIEGRARMAAEKIAQDVAYVSASVSQFVAAHPIIAKRYAISLDLPIAALAKALYDCYCDSGHSFARGELTRISGHGSWICDVDPLDIQGAWMAASRLAKVTANLR